MRSDTSGNKPPVNVNATGAPQALPYREPGRPGREAHEREAALERGRARRGTPPPPLCAPHVPGLDADLLYSLVAENVRDYAIFLMNGDGIITCWGESARLMKWWTKTEAEGSHLRMLYPDGGSEDGTAEAHLMQAVRSHRLGSRHRSRAGDQ